MSVMSSVAVCLCCVTAATWSLVPSRQQQQQPVAQQAAGTNQDRGDATSALAAAMTDAKYSRQDASSPVQPALSQQVEECQPQPATADSGYSRAHRVRGSLFAFEFVRAAQILVRLQLVLTLAGTGGCNPPRQIFEDAAKTRCAMY